MNKNQKRLNLWCNTMKTVKAVTYIDGYRLKLLFDDQKTKIVDLIDMAKKGGHYFNPLHL